MYNFPIRVRWAAPLAWQNQNFLRIERKHRQHPARKAPQWSVESAPLCSISPADLPDQGASLPFMRSLLPTPKISTSAAPKTTTCMSAAQLTRATSRGAFKAFDRRTTACSEMAQLSLEEVCTARRSSTDEWRASATLTRPPMLMGWKFNVVIVSLQS